jgi:hypothetical protein
MPEAQVTLVSDQAHAINSDIFDRIITIPPINQNVDPNHVGYLKKIKGMSVSPYEWTLFVDSDTRFGDSVWEVFSVLNDYDLAVASAPYRARVSNISFEQFVKRKNLFLPALNTGVVGFNNSDKIKKFFSIWENIFLEKAPDNGEYFSDQTVFREALAKSEVRPMVLPPEYNFRIGLPQQIHGLVKIFHGRPKQGWKRHIEIVNSSQDYRLYLPSIASICLKQGYFEVEGFSKNQEKIEVPYQQLQERLTNGSKLSLNKTSD